jgi:hypothetical protein
VAALHGLVQKKIGQLVRQSMVQARRATQGDQAAPRDQLTTEASSAVMLGEEESFARLHNAPALDSTLPLLGGALGPSTAREGVEQQQSRSQSQHSTSLDLLESQLLHESDLDYLERCSLGAHTLTTSCRNRLVSATACICQVVWLLVCLSCVRQQKTCE